MKARFQNHINEHDGECESVNNFPNANLKAIELNRQQRELVSMGDELKRNISDPNSPFQNFLKYSPDALHNLFDQCLIKPHYFQVQGTIFFDFFLFKSDPWNNSEMEIFATIISAKKERFLLHPLFETFLQIKWRRTAYTFYLFVVWILFYQVTLIFYSLNRFTFLSESIIKHLLEASMLCFYFALIVNCVFSFLLYVITIVQYFKYAKKWCFFLICFGILKSFTWHLAQPIMCGFFVFGQLEEKTARSLCAILVFMASVQSMETLARLPRVGIQTLMMTKVFLSVTTFFSSFGPAFIAFCVIFHVLLPSSASFARLEDSFLKVLSMLMGELDFTNSFIVKYEANFVAKLFFLLFLIVMALVFMNLLLGLAVSDIEELERISRMRRAIVEFHTIASMEKIVTALRYNL